MDLINNCPNPQNLTGCYLLGINSGNGSSGESGSPAGEVKPSPTLTPPPESPSYDPYTQSCLHKQNIVIWQSRIALWELGFCSSKVQSVDSSRTRAQTVNKKTL